jgi:hypothetical protein
MTRMGKNRETTTTTIRPFEDDLEKLDEICDAEDKSRSEKIRELISREVDRHDDDAYDADALPSDERLRDAYETLLDVSEEVFEGGGQRCTLEEAKNSLYSNRIPKDAVRKQLVKPLKDDDLVRVDRGMSSVWIVVRPRDAVMQSSDGRAVATDGGKR